MRHLHFVINGLLYLAIVAVVLFVGGLVVEFLYHCEYRIRVVLIGIAVLIAAYVIGRLMD